MFKKIAFTFFIKIIIAVINLAVVVILSRYIGAAGKGEASLILTTIAMILLFCNIVGGSSLVYFVPRYNILRLFLLSNGWSVIVCVISYLLFMIFPIINPNVILSVILLSLINSFLATNLTIILGKEMISTYNLISLLQAVLNILVLIFMIEGMNERNIGSYILSLYAAMGLCLAISFVYIYPIIRQDKTPAEKNLAGELFKYGLYSQAGHIMKFASFRCTYYMLAGFAGEVMLGIFSNGVSLIESVLLISNSIATFLYPKVSNSESIKNSQALTLQLTRLSNLLCCIAILVLILLPSAFFVWLFGEEFRDVHQVIILLAPGILFYNIALVIGHYFSGTGQFKVNTYANLSGLITTVICLMIWYPNFGIFEISIISSISYIATAAFIIVYFIKQSGMKSVGMIPGTGDIKWMITETKSLIKKDSSV
jgi:O-antigen/teichoic acid export membrane protein